MIYGADLPDPNLPWPIIYEGVTLLARREKCVLVAYLDWPSKVPTIGWGETEGVSLGMRWTQQQADKRLCDELTKYSGTVAQMCTINPTEHQLAALTVCAYNIGLAAMRESSMMRLHNAGRPMDAARAFSMWNKAHDAETGKLIEIEELTSRRAAEASLYLETDEGVPQYPSPQAVAPQPTITRSPTMNGSIAAIVTGATTLISSATGSLSQVKDVLADFGLSAPQALALALIAFGSVVAYRRWQQREKGVA